ncbi:MAG TPA: V-type ATP synthase subunit D [Victivallales bacterium]|nr:V-type ATP synthase subunit D [Victivallales bacterium]
MPKIKLTKSELKHQRDSLKQFQRFLPTLQLKKQQLQLEIRKCEAKTEKLREEEKNLEDAVLKWIEIFSMSDLSEKIPQIIQIKNIVTSNVNIAGLDVPVLERLDFDEKEYDLFETPPSLDDAIEFLKKSLKIHVERMIVEKQLELITNELRTTSQRVNLFEKVKIPEAKDSIRMIQIYLGDEDTAAVGRSKIAKRKMTEAA